MEQSRRYGTMDMDTLLETLDQMRDEPPRSGDVLDFLLDFFTYLDQEGIRLSIAYEGSGTSRYAQLAERLAELACWDPENPAGELYRQLLDLVQEVLCPESVPDMEVRQRLERIRELLTLLQFYRESQPWEFEQAMSAYLGETVEKIKGQMWRLEPPPEVRRKMQSMNRELEHTRNQLKLEKARADRLQKELDMAMAELNRRR